MKKIKLLALSLIYIGTIKAQQNTEYFPDPNPEIQKRLEEWKDLKFGLLMHWGPYSQWGVVESWSICPEDVGWATGGRKKGLEENYNEYLTAYQNLPKTFNPTKFNPEKWAMAAKEAGMKYMIFTTKHHDGFCMFDSQYTDYKITSKNVPFSKNPKKNITKEVFYAFRKEKIWVGAYFSKPDWNTDYYWWKKFPPADRNPNYAIEKYPEQWKKFVDFTHNQLNELVTNYGTVDILWLDGGWVRKRTEEEIEKALLTKEENIRSIKNPISQDINMPLLVKEVREKQPQVLVVDRDVPGEQQNYLTPEQHIPENGLPYPWETCMTMGNSWSYVPNDTYKSSDDLIKKLVDVVSKGGNYLLNIGPGPDGEFAPEAYQRLKEIGQWIKINGEAIYKTRMYKTFGEGENIRFTQTKDGKIKYIFIFNTNSNKIKLSKMNFSKNDKLILLENKQNLSWKYINNTTEINIPNNFINAQKTVWVIKIYSQNNNTNS